MVILRDWVVASWLSVRIILAALTRVDTILACADCLTSACVGACARMNEGIKIKLKSKWLNTLLVHITVQFLRFRYWSMRLADDLTWLDLLRLWCLTMHFFAVQLRKNIALAATTHHICWLIRSNRHSCLADFTSFKCAFTIVEFVQFWRLLARKCIDLLRILCKIIWFILLMWRELLLRLRFGRWASSWVDRMRDSISTL